MKSSLSFNDLPPTIGRKLRQSANRIRRILFLRGLVVSIAVGLVALLTIMGIDAAVVIYSSLLRWCFTLSGAGCVLLTAWLLIIKPLSKRWTPAQLAVFIESRHPELEERISTVVELLSIPEARERGSQQLIEVLKEAAELDVKSISPKDEFTGRTIWRKLAFAVGAFLVMAVLIAVWPRHVGRLLIRAVLPSAEVSNVYADNITVSPEDSMVLIGEPLEITLNVRQGFPGQANMLREVKVDGARRETTERMRQVDGEEGAGQGDRVYRLLIPSVDETFRYRISCGHALTRHYRISAIPRPAITNFQVTCIYPDYVQRAPLVANHVALADLAILAGCTLQIRADFNKPELLSALTISNQQAVVYNKVGESSHQWELPIAKEASGQLTFYLKDGYGFTNLPAQVAYRSVADRAPEIQLVNPGETSIKLPPDGRINFAFTVSDDYGVEPPRLLASADGGEYELVEKIEMKPVEGLVGLWSGAASLSLSRISSIAKRYRFQIQVEDRLPSELGGPNRTVSPVVIVEVDREALSLERQLIAERADALNRELSSAIRLLEEAEKRAELLEKSAAMGKEPSKEEQRQLQQARQEITQAEDLVKKLAEDTKDTAFDRLKDPLKKLRDQSIEPARLSADEASMEKDQRQRANLLKDTKEKLASAVEEAKQLQAQVDQMAKQLDELAKLEEMAASQQELAEKVEQISDQDSLKEWSDQQQALEQQAEKSYLEDLQAQRDAKLEEAKALQEMSAQAEQLAKQQEKLQNSEQNQQAQQQQDQLAHDVEQLADRANRQEADSGEHMQNATQEAQKAAEKMKQGQDAKQAQEQAKKELESAAKRFEQARQEAATAAEELQKQIDQQSSDQQSGEAPKQDDMQKALDAMKQAQEQAQQMMKNQEQGLSPEQKEALKQAAQQAAEQLQQSLQQQAQKQDLPMPSQMKTKRPNIDSSSGMPNKPQPPEDSEDAVPGELRGRVPEAEWFRFKGDVKAGALEEALRRVPAEYRDLVKRYFQGLSEGMK